jgi:hypothetical protein
VDIILTMVFVKTAQALTITQSIAQMQPMLLHVLQDISCLILFATLAKGSIQYGQLVQMPLQSLDVLLAITWWITHAWVVIQSTPIGLPAAPTQSPSLATQIITLIMVHVYLAQMFIQAGLTVQMQTQQLLVLQTITSTEHQTAAFVHQPINLQSTAVHCKTTLIAWQVLSSTVLFAQTAAPWTLLGLPAPIWRTPLHAFRDTTSTTPLSALLARRSGTGGLPATTTPTPPAATLPTSWTPSTAPFAAFQTPLGSRAPLQAAPSPAFRDSFWAETTALPAPQSTPIGLPAAPTQWPSPATQITTLTTVHAFPARASTRLGSTALMLLMQPSVLQTITSMEHQTAAFVHQPINLQSTAVHCKTTLIAWQVLSSTVLFAQTAAPWTLLGLPAPIWRTPLHAFRDTTSTTPLSALLARRSGTGGLPATTTPTPPAATLPTSWTPSTAPFAAFQTPLGSRAPLQAAPSPAFRDSFWAETTALPAPQSTPIGLPAAPTQWPSPATQITTLTTVHAFPARASTRLGSTALMQLTPLSALPTITSTQHQTAPFAPQPINLQSTAPQRSSTLIAWKLLSLTVPYVPTAVQWTLLGLLVLIWPMQLYVSQDTTLIIVLVLFAVQFILLGRLASTLQGLCLV